MKSILLVFVVPFFLGIVETHKILCFFPTVSKSQLIFAQPLMVALADKGHQVTVVSQFPLGKNVTNYRDVVVPIDMDSHERMLFVIDLMPM